MSAEDIRLLQRYEPVLRYTRGEQFFPVGVDCYVGRCSFWMQHPNEAPIRLLGEGEVTLEKLVEPRTEGFDTVHYLKFIEPLNIAEMAAYRLREGLARKDPKKVFHAGRGRLARVGYGSRFVDALFSLTLLMRGRVPGDTAAAAALTCDHLLDEHDAYTYYGRVLRRDGWAVLQYWFFYPFNNWRSGFYGVNDHEADWEMVCVYLYEHEGGELVPEWVGFASHDYYGDDLRRRWDDPEVEKAGEHPIVYVGAGSHAAYYTAGEYLAEIELPFLSPLVRLADALQTGWRKLLKLTHVEEEANANNTGFNVFRIPFVDYARGDGAIIGPGGDQEWNTPRLLNPVPEWVSHYRGLWGLYTRDAISGENAPAGPMYNQDGTVRRAWYDPLGWAGLDKVAPPNQSLDLALQRHKEISAHQNLLKETINTRSEEIRNLDVEARAMRGQAHLKETYAEHIEKIKTLSEELDKMRAELAADEALLEALDGYAKMHEEGRRGPARAHIRRAMLPESDEGLFTGRFVETWSAISIGLMMVGFVGIVFFARQYFIFGLAALISVIVFVEAGFRRQLTRLINSIAIGLAIASALVLLFEFFWQIIVLGVLIAGGYIMWENLRELWT